MANKKPLLLLSVLAKVRDLSIEKYDGKVYDNILGIFNRLTTQEKRTLLRGLINICFIVEDKVILNKSDLEPLKDMVDQGIKDLEDITKGREECEVDLKSISDYVDTILKSPTEQEVVLTPDTEDRLKVLKAKLHKLGWVVVFTVCFLVFVLFTAFDASFYNTLVEHLLTVMKFLLVL